jgi:hypothetical protein
MRGWDLGLGLVQTIAPSQLERDAKAERTADVGSARYKKKKRSPAEGYSTVERRALNVQSAPHDRGSSSIIDARLPQNVTDPSKTRGKKEWTIKKRK